MKASWLVAVVVLALCQAGDCDRADDACSAADAEHRQYLLG